MQIIRDGFLYRATRVMCLIFDSFLRNEHRLSAKQLAVNRLTMGRIDICTFCQVWLIGSLYIIAGVGLPLAFIWFAMISPYIGAPGDLLMAGLNGWLQLAIFLVVTIGSFVLLMAVSFGITWGAGRLQRYLRNRRKKVDDTDTREEPSPNPLVSAIEMRYRAFKEKTCFYVPVVNSKSEMDH